MQHVKKLLSLLLALCLLTGMLPVPVAAAAGFSDTSGHWAEDAIDRWASYGVIEGDGTGAFQPAAPVTRGALAKIIAVTMGYETQAANTFTDLPDGAWYTPYVLQCAAAGVMSGYGDGRMGPEDPVTRQEACKMLASALAVAPDSAPAVSFTDQAAIASWALPYVSAMARLGYIQGIGNGQFAPEQTMDRASVVTILDNVVAEYLCKSGTYTSLQSGLVIIAADGVTLKDVTVHGDLIIAADGAKLDKVTVTGNLTVLDGHTAALTDCQINGQTQGSVEVSQTPSGNHDNDNDDDDDDQPAPLPTPVPEEDKVVSLNWNTYAMACGKDNDSGETLTLSVSYDKSAYTAPQVRWTSSDPTIVAVQSDSGDSVTVQARTTGFVSVTAELYDGEKLIGSDVCAITSIDGYDRATMQTLELSASELTLAADGQAVTLTPLFFPVDIPTDGKMLDTSLEVVEDYDSSVIQVSLNEDQNYADFADIGALAKEDVKILYDQVVVTPVAAGQTTFTVRSKVNGRTATCTVTVTDDALDVTGLTGGSDEVITLTVGQQGQNTRQLTVTPEGGQSDIVWTSSNPYIASVDQNGLVTARSTSNYEERRENSSALDADDDNYKTVTITATSVKGGFTQSFKVMVLPAATVVTGLSVNKDALNLAAGSEGYLTASVSPASVLSPEVVWTSSNPDVLAVEAVADTVYGAAQAKLTAKSAGTATVTAAYEGHQDTCQVTVTDGEVKVDSITLSGPQTLVRDQVAELTAQVTATATNQQLYWLSDNRTVVTVDQEGNLQGYEAGTANIYAIALDSLTDAQKQVLFFTADLDKTADEQAPSDELAEVRNISADPDAKQALDELLQAENVVYACYPVTVDGSASLYLRNLHIPEETITSQSVALLWNRDSLYTAGDLTGTQVTANGALVAELGNEMSYTVKGLSPDTEYTFTVTTFYGDGQSVSETITARTDPAPQVLNVLDFGAVGDGSTLDTAAIQAAIDACPENGEVWLPAGHVFYSGALFLKSDMTLRVDGILMGSTDPKDYPRMVSRWEGWRKIYQPAEEWAGENERTGLDYAGQDNEYVYSSLLTVGVYDEGENGYTANYNTENVTICGQGQINANGYQLGYNEGPNSAVFGGSCPNIDQSLVRSNVTIRGHVLVTHNVKGLYVTDVMIANGPAWTIDLIYSEDITLDNISVVALSNYQTEVGKGRNYILNGDGCDVDSSTHTNILNSFFRAGDDAIAAKSGKNLEGWLRGKPTAYLRVTDVFSLGSRYGLIIGSEMAGGAHDILFQNNEFKDNVSDNSMWIKAPRERGGLVEDILYRDIINNSSKAAIRVEADYSDSYKKTPSPINTRIRRLTYENLVEMSTAASSFKGKDNSIIRDVVIRGADFKAPVSLANIDGVTLIDVEAGYKDAGNAQNVTVINPALEQDVGLALAEDAFDVKAVDLQAGTVTVRKGTTVAQLTAQIQPEKAAPGEQSYAVAGRQADDPLAEGDQLTVTAKNGTNTRVYTVTFYRVDEIASSTEIESVPGGSVTAIQTGGLENSLSVRTGATVQDLLDSLRSTLGGTQSLAVYADRDSAQAGQSPLEAGTVLASGSYLRVDAEDASQSALYRIAVEIPTVSFTLTGAEVGEKSDSFTDGDIKEDNQNGSDHYFQANAEVGEYFQLAQPLEFLSSASYTVEMSAKTASSRGVFDVVLVPQAGGESITVGSIDMRSSGGLNIDSAVEIPAASYFLRFVCTTKGYFTGRSITFLPVEKTDSGLENLALNQPVTVSSEEKPDICPAAMAVDGVIENKTGTAADTMNSWKSKEIPAYIEVDLGQVCQLNNIHLYWESKDTREYYFTVSVKDEADGTYTQVIDHSKDSAPYETDDQFPAGTQARYVRVDITGCSKSGTTVATLRELEVYGLAG